MIDFIAWLTTASVWNWLAIPALMGWVLLILFLLRGVIHTISKAIRHHRRKKRTRPAEYVRGEQ